MKNVVLTDKAKDLKKRVMALPDQIRCSMRMNDDELETLKNSPERCSTICKNPSVG
jgi:hypothetical protein